MNKTKILVLDSGSGQILSRLIDSCKDTIPATVVFLISASPEAASMEVARKAGIGGIVMPAHLESSPPEECASYIQSIISLWDAQLVVAIDFLNDELCHDVLHLLPMAVGMLYEFGESEVIVRTYLHTLRSRAVLSRMAFADIHESMVDDAELWAAMRSSCFIPALNELIEAIRKMELV